MAGAPPRPPSDLRVCADPYDMPFSNNQEEGFENKIAHLVARDLNATVINTGWPSRRGVLRNSILGGFCDVMIQAPVGLDPVATTKPYYRSTYYFVFRADRGLQLRSLDDTILKRLKIGVNMIATITPTRRRRTRSARAASWASSGSGTSSIRIRRPTSRRHHQCGGEGLDRCGHRVGTLAGYWAKRQSVPLTLVALPDSDAVSGMPFAFSMAMAVRHRDKALKATLDSVIDRRRSEITEICASTTCPMIEMHP